MMKTRTGRAALTALLALSAFTLVGCSTGAVITTAVPPTPQTSIPELADVAAAPVIFDASTDVDAVEFPESMKGNELAQAREWVQTNVITAQCMKEKGYDYTFRPNWAWSAEPSWITKLPEDQKAAAGVSLDGPGQTPGDYRWEDAGCWGYAVHVMGNDDKH